MTKRPGRAVVVRRREARTLLAKAEEFLGAARRASEVGAHDATLLASVHAAIMANDAICVALLGLRSSDADHARAVDLLESAAQLEDGVALRARQLRALLEAKSPVAYEARRATSAEGRDGLERAARFVDWAELVLARARL
ncbi:MAG: HEPN domain-containing protein [Candidatus Limnocylindria bacterium]|nr:HEPN domain-containing protein [Candidatus Limnocylindria bacterium]